ncbi:MAG: hypothetical protein ISS78_01015 [Phycisphaerae bacterium]|nr:hypothetical protein [Phycisphaerae bacterium]
MRYFRGRSVVFLGAVVFAGTLVGCGVGPWLAWQLSPAQTVAAQYEPPEGKMILVFPDDMLRPVNYEPVKQILASEINRLLVKNKIAAVTVPYQNLAEMESKTSGFNKLSVSEVGQKLGAHIVLYVHIDRFSLKDDEANPLWHGKLEATVRMVEVKKGLLWPKDRPAGWPVEPLDVPTTEDSKTYDTRLARILAERMAERIVNLFCKHTADQRPSKLACQARRREYNVAGQASSG